MQKKEYQMELKELYAILGQLSIEMEIKQGQYKQVKEEIAKVLSKPQPKEPIKNDKPKEKSKG